MDGESRSKYQSGAVEKIHRSAIKGAEYNPRIMSAPAKRRLRDNIKSRGLMGPAIVVNRVTGNVVSGHQRLQVVDALEGTSDYSLEVTMVELTPAQEREQNIHMNSPDSQGEFDVALLGEMLTSEEIKLDLDKASLDLVTVELTFAGTEFEGALAKVFEAPAEAKKKERPGINARLKEARDERNERDRVDAECYLVLVFTEPKEAEDFAERLGMSKESRYLDGRMVAKLIAGD